MPRLSVLYRPKFRATGFVVEGIDNPDIRVIPLELKKDRLSYVLYGVFLALRLYRLAFFFRFTDATRVALKAMEGKVLFWDCCYFKEYRMMNAVLRKDLDKNVFFWNPLTRWSRDVAYVQHEIKYLSGRNYSFCTFDQEDSRKYGIRLVNNVNRDLKVVSDGPVKQDFYFVGAPKDRRDMLRELESKLRGKGFSTKFLLVESKSDYISNEENIRLSAESACIVDVVAKGQAGLTLRPLDALFLKKKLLTNNVSVEKADFYDPDNIYIIRDAELTGIEDFMKAPYKNPDKAIVERYEVNRWVRDNFLN